MADECIHCIRDECWVAKRHYYRDIDTDLFRRQSGGYSMFIDPGSQDVTNICRWLLSPNPPWTSILIVGKTRQDVCALVELREHDEHVQHLWRWRLFLKYDMSRVSTVYSTDVTGLFAPPTPCK